MASFVPESLLDVVAMVCASPAWPPQAMFTEVIERIRLLCAVGDVLGHFAHVAIQVDVVHGFAEGNRFEF